MNKLLIIVGVTFQFSLLFAQTEAKNIFSEEEAMKLSAYGKNLEASILEKNPADTALIAKLTGDFSKDLCGYTDEEVIKISNYLKELEKQDSINKAEAEAVVEEPVVEEPVVATPVVEPVKPAAPAFDNTLLFGSNSAQPKIAQLDALVAAMKADPKMEITLEGYADATASNDFNMALSKNRAKAVQRYLISKGIDAKRMTIVAHGEDNPVGDNTTEEGKAKNRRVVISTKK